MHMKIAALTSQAGTKGVVMDPSNGGFHHVDYYAFVENFQDLNVWKQMPVWPFSTDVTYTGRRNAKLAKVLGWMMVPGYDYYVWHDSGCEIQVDPVQIIQEHMPDGVHMALWKHPDRTCAYAEAETVVGYGFEKLETAQACVNFLLEKSWPYQAGLFEMSSFVYKNCPQVQALMLSWWELICKYSSRDQILFPYVARMHDIRWQYLPGKAQKYAGNNKLIPQVR